MAEKFKVVISGISGRFPECDDLDTFKEKLYNGGDFITVDDRKWPVGFKHERLGRKLIPDATGKFLDVSKYDQTVFRMNKVLSQSTDIQNRKILEPSFEAIVDAGINPYSLDGSNVSVFMSSSVNELDANVGNLNIPKKILFLVGLNKTMMANRVSYALNLKGPSYTTYVDVHGGLDSLALGYRYVSEGLVDAAVVGACSSIVDPRMSFQHFSLGLLSPDGVTRPFDEWANGYARSESAVCFYLQRAEDAKRSYGEIIFCDSRCLGFDLPNFIECGESYVKTCMQQFLEACEHNNSKSRVAFVEMNAMGHKILDKIESEVVAELMAKEEEEPLLVGSIKSNVGNVEAAAGLMSVLKALLALDSGALAPNRNLQKLNEDVQAFRTKQLEVVTERRSLPGTTIAVNSLGLMGTIGLAILQQHENVPKPPAQSDEVSIPRILLICGRQENDLKKKLTQIEESPYNPEFIALANDAFRQCMPVHTYRAFALLPPPFKPVNCVKEKGERNRPVWFVFSGMGSQWNGMGKSLLKLPLFAETVAKCDRVLRQKNIDIYHILTSDDNTIFDDILNAFVGIITVQIGLYEVIKALGIKADGIIGHSVGENACAYADGCLTLEQAVLASWARGKASNEVKTTKGMMAAIGKGYSDMKDILPDGIHVACHNSADNCTLTGPAESVNSYVQVLKEEGVFARAVNVANIAYHSKYIAPIAPRLRDRLERVIEEPKRRSSKWISTSVPESKWETFTAQYCSAEYLTNNLLSPVLFEEGCQHIPADAICIEFAPHGLLQAILKRSLPDTCTNIPLSSRGKTEDNLNFLLSRVGMLYIAGLDPEVNNIYPAVQYPVPRGTPHISPCCTWHHEEGPVPYILQSHHEDDLTISRDLMPICVREDSKYAYLKDHTVDGNIVIPPSFFISLTCEMFLSELMKDESDQSTLVLECVRVHRVIVISMHDTKYASVMILLGSGSFQVTLQDCEEIWDSGEVVLTGYIHNTLSRDVAPQLPTSTAGTGRFVTKIQFHDDFEQAGYKLGKEFALVEGVKCMNAAKYGGEITWNGNWVAFLDMLMKVQMFVGNAGNVEDVVPTCIERLEITTSRYRALSKGTALPYDIDNSTKELRCMGLVMRSLKYGTRTKPEVLLTSYRFVPYSNPRCQDIPEFLHLCLQIAIENIVASNPNSNQEVLTVLDRTGQYQRIVGKIIKQASLESAVILDSGKAFGRSECTHILMITDGREEITEINMPMKNLLFILMVSQSTSLYELELGSDCTKLVQQSFSVDEFTLSRKGAIPGTKEIDCSSRFIVPGKNLHIDDVSRMLSIETPSPGERYLYVMDEILDEEKLDKFVEKQNELYAPVLVLKHEELGVYRSLIYEIGQEREVETTMGAQFLSQIRAGPEQVNYVCFDELKDVPKKQNFGFSYIATVNSSEQRLGFATVSSTGNVQYDPCLRWILPKNCSSSEEAVTMIYIYALAYKLLVLFPSHRLKYAETAMINVGTEYLLAEAFIVLALYKSLKIFVIVDSDEDAARIKNRFPELPPDYIFYSNHCRYIQVKRFTEGRGIDLFVNCLRGIEHLETSLTTCLAVNGVYVEVGTDNCQWSNEMGLHPFLKLISVYVMPKEVSKLLELPVETKQTMQKFIDNLMKKEVLKPLKMSQTSMKSMNVIDCPLTGEIQNCPARTIKYDREHSYLILGTSLDDPSLLALIGWLINQGAGKFMIALEELSVLPQTVDRINRISSRADACILFSSAADLDNRGGAASLLEQIDEKLGPLEAAFCIGIRKAGDRISNLDGLVSSEVCFIGLASAGLKEFERRSDRGCPVLFLHGDEPKSVMRALPHLNQLLGKTDDNNNNVEILHHVTNPNGRGINVPRFRLRDYLPRNLEMLSRIGEDDTIEPSFVEMSSSSNRYHHCKGVYPIFALPAVHSSTLQPLFQRLQHPVFSATTTSIGSVKDVAGALYSSLTKIQCTGPISIISETWTLPMALELISYANRDSRDYKIFILEGIPEIWSARVERLLSMGPRKLDALLGDEIFHFIEKSRKDHSREDVPFEDNIRMFAEAVSGDQRTSENVIKGARKTRNVIAELTRLRFPVELLEHVIWLERSRPSERALKLSASSEILVFDEPSYRQLLDHPGVSRAINKNALYNWWEYRKPENVE